SPWSKQKSGLVFSLSQFVHCKVEERVPCLFQIEHDYATIWQILFIASYLRVQIYPLVLAGDLKCRIKKDGFVQIRGIRIPCSEFLSSFPGEFKLRVQDLSPSGPFRICFKLPGPVEPRLFAPTYRDGILEGIVMKCRMPSAAQPAPQKTA
ncbi:Increased DNA methylation 3, partial [Linum perenne]